MRQREESGLRMSEKDKNRNKEIGKEGEGNRGRKWGKQGGGGAKRRERKPP